MKTICLYFIYFIIYAFIGWSIEVIGKLIEKHKFINRGFLVGPICPIYGYGVLGILGILSIGSGNDDVFTVFLKSVFVCSILEYGTSYFMEKLFNARWWDYSRRKFNINGRICLNTMIPFGLLGVALKYVIHPFISKYVTMLTNEELVFMASFLFAIYLIDNIFSFVIMKKIKNKINTTDKDNTEAIKEYINKWLDSNSYFYRRIKNAYPNFVIKIKGIEGKAIDYKNMFVHDAETLKENYYANKKQLKELYKKNKKNIKKRK